MKKEILDTKFIHNSWFKQFNQTTKKWESYKTKREALMYFAFQGDSYLDEVVDTKKIKGVINANEDLPTKVRLVCGKQSYTMSVTEIEFYKECEDVRKDYNEYFKIAFKEFEYQNKIDKLENQHAKYKDYQKLEADFAKFIREVLPSDEMLIKCWEQLNGFQIKNYEDLK